ncbi:MAG TPA: hypothetical protein PKN48_08945 [Bacteroidales bacterium]|nr:hypothetical protein [Bacteroidales bacterium]
MDKKEIKKKLLDTCMQLHQKSAERIMAEMAEAYQNAEEYGTPEDWLDTYKMDMLNKRDAFGVQLQKIRDEIKILERIDPTKMMDKVSFGSVVITKNQKLFISVGLGKIVLETDTYFAISQSVPLFHAIKELKAGDTFSFLGADNKILEVY